MAPTSWLPASKWDKNHHVIADDFDVNSVRSCCSIAGWHSKLTFSINPSRQDQRVSEREKKGDRVAGVSYALYRLPILYYYYFFREQLQVCNILDFAECKISLFHRLPLFSWYAECIGNKNGQEQQMLTYLVLLRTVEEPNMLTSAARLRRSSIIVCIEKATVTS